MAAKNEKISDVKKPEKVSAEPTSRPLIVTNRPVMVTDPMVLQGASQPATAPETNKTTAVVQHGEKVINPVSDMKAPVETEAASEPEVAVQAAEPTEQAAVLEVPAPDAPESPAEKTVEDSPKAEEVVADEAVESDDPVEPTRDSAAAQANSEAEAEEAKTEREQELDLLIASGKYNVPINAVQRKRSRMFVIILCVLALLLAAVLLDAALDAGLVSLPFDVPHTNFFSKS